MRKLYSIFKVYLKDGMSYRGDLLLYTLSGVAFPVLVLLVWLAVDSSGQILFFSRNDFVVYYLATLVISLWTAAWGGIFISRDIRNGKLSPFLLRPAPYLFFQLGNNIAEKMLKSVMLLPVLVTIILTFSARFPALSFVTWLLIICSSILAASIFFLVDICLGFSAFWLDDSTALADSWDLFYYLFSGKVIPLVALPLLWQQIAVYLPFRYTLSFPVELFLGKLSAQDIFTGFAFQLFWLFLFLLIYSILWAKGRRKYSAVGA